MKSKMLSRLILFFSSVIIIQANGSPVYAAPDFKVEKIGKNEVFYAVGGSSASDVFAGGDGLALYHYDGTAWSIISEYSNYQNDIKAFWGISGSNMYAVCEGKENEKILHYDGKTLSAVDITIPDEYPYHDTIRDYGFMDIWGVSDTEMYLVMSQAVYFFNGSTIQRMKSEPPPGYAYPELLMSPKAIWGTSGSNIIAVGTDIYNYDGTAWHLMYDLEDGLYLSDIWGSSATDIYAVGGNSSKGVIFHYDGSAWTQVTIGNITEPFKSVWASSASDVYAATQLTLLHYDGSSWTPVTYLQGSTMFCVWGTSSKNVYVSSDDGFLFHYKNTGGSSNPDECGDKKIPLLDERKNISPAVTALPVLGVDPENISPLGFGNIAEGGKEFTLSAGLCPFEVPMSFLFMYGWNAIPYVIAADNKVVNFSMGDNMTDFVLPPSNEIEDYLWKSNVDGSIREEISGDFGGLFVDTQHLPRDSSFYLIAFPLDSVQANGGDIPPIYMWSYDLKDFIDVHCEGKTPQPEGKEIFFVKPAAVPVTGTDPKKIQPFSVGPYALGGDILAMSVDFCQFDSGWIDTHFGIYCPSEDLFNIYFVNGDAQTEEDLFQKVALFKFLFAGELPPFAQSKDWGYDNMQPYPTVFFKGSLSGLPKKRCYYIAAVSPPGVRDKFYAWIVSLNVNIKDAFTKSLIEKHN